MPYATWPPITMIKNKNDVTYCEYDDVFLKLSS